MVHGAQKYKTMCLANLDVKAVFDVAEPCCVSEISRSTGVNGWRMAALLDIKDLQEEKGGKGSCRIVRDGIQVLRMHQARQRGGTDAVDEVREVFLFFERGLKVKEREEGLWRWRQSAPHLGGPLWIMNESKTVLRRRRRT